jgi:spore germination protein
MKKNACALCVAVGRNSGYTPRVAGSNGTASMSQRPVTGILLRAGIGVVAVALLGPAASASLQRRVSANLVFWDQNRGFDTIIANADVLSEVSPFWYHVGADGRILPYRTEAGATYEDSSIPLFLRGRGILVIPSVTNIVDGVWDGALVSRIIDDPVLAAANISNLVQLAVNNSYDGIDLDYENLAASDRGAFSAFVTQLANALHAKGKLLTVNVYAKTSEPGSWDGPIAQDWSVIGAAADQVRIMTYEYHWSTSGPGPIAPIDWVGQVLSFARTVIPPAKIMQGVPFYGYDWVGQSGVPIVWKEAVGLAAQYGAAINWDPNSASPWFAYGVRKSQHTVWFENAASVDAKLALTAAHNIGGVTLWRLGGEDPDAWLALRSRFGGVAPPADTVPPSVYVISPANGAQLQRKQRIQAEATDSVAVTRVEFYVNGALLSSDTTAPYVVYWNTNRALDGANLIVAVAYDAAGNSNAAQVTAYH